MGARAEPWIGLALCVTVVLVWAWEQLVPNPDGSQALAAAWLPLAGTYRATSPARICSGSSRSWRS